MRERIHDEHRHGARVADRLFVGGCTLAYAVLIVSVLAALRMYAA